MCARCQSLLYLFVVKTDYSALSDNQKNITEQKTLTMTGVNAGIIPALLPFAEGL